RHVVEALLTELESAETLERVAPPRAVVHPVSHRLAVLSIARDVDTDVPLPAHDVLHRRSELLLPSLRVERSARLANPVRLEQSAGPGQASGVTREDATVAGLH